MKNGTFKDDKLFYEDILRETNSSASCGFTILRLASVLSFVYKFSISYFHSGAISAVVKSF